MSALDTQTQPLKVEPLEPLPVEQTWQRWIYTLLALVVVGGFLIANTRYYWVPAHSGVDQNGYLVGGRMLAEHLTMRLNPTMPGSNQFDPHQFVGRMWVGADLGTDHERYYPKYPLGMPALVAVSLWIGGDSWGPWLAYLINPFAMALAVLATYLLVGQVAGSFWALCGTLIFASSPVIFGLTTVPNSHATAAAFSSWGMYFLLRWWKTHGIWRGVLAGFLLAYAATIRYTEGLLVLPLITVVILGMRWREKRAWLEAFSTLLAWAVPISLLVWYNVAAMGHITGYDGTNESSGFAWQYAADNWESMIRQLGTTALYFTFPFSVIGLFVMLVRNWKVGLVLAMWIVPSILAYTFYYWAPDPLLQQGNFVGYMRFYVTIFPPLIMTAYWLMDHVCKWVQKPRDSNPWALPLTQACFGIVTLVALAVNLDNSTFAAEGDEHSRLMLQTTADQILNVAPAGSVIFAQDTQLMHHLQFLRDYKLYTAETFNKNFIDGLPQMDPDEPQGWEPGRRDALYDRLKDYTQPQLDDDARKIMTAALDSGSRVFFVLPRQGNDPPMTRRKFGGEAKTFPGAQMVLRFAKPDQYDIQLVATWNTPVVRPPQPGSTARSPRRRFAVQLDRRATSWQIIEVEKKTTPVNPPPVKQGNKPKPTPANH